MNGRLTISRTRSFCQNATREADEEREQGDEDARAQLVEVLDQAELVLVADGSQRGGHGRPTDGLGDDLAVERLAVRAVAAGRQLGVVVLVVRR